MSQSVTVFPPALAAGGDRSSLQCSSRLIRVKAQSALALHLCLEPARKVLNLPLEPMNDDEFAAADVPPPQGPSMTELEWICRSGADVLATAI